MRGKAYIVALMLMLLAFAGVVLGCSADGRVAMPSSLSAGQADDERPGAFSLAEIPPYDGSPSVQVNGGVPFFQADELTLEPREVYSALDSLGRCGVATALVGPETMPTGRRGSIGMVKPSGWRISEYDWIDGKYLFNRCHLIAFSLAGENDNALNLITGTRYLNTQGMLPVEERVASYVDRTAHHVLYRATPVFEGDNLVASGVLLEAQSVEDGEIRLCEWCYNVEPGVQIDYATGGNHADGSIAEEEAAGEPAQAEPDQAAPADPGQAEGEAAAPVVAESAPRGAEGESDQPGSVMTYVLNTNTHRFHYPDCPSVSKMKEKNKQVFEGTRDQVLALEYVPCGSCNP